LGDTEVMTKKAKHTLLLWRAILLAAVIFISVSKASAAQEETTGVIKQAIDTGDTT
jgi:hypothetical protein